ncbi:MAG: imidazole glycerol phosphate synthase subunit HisH [Euryarchaeota archaeon]|nr:imidazole glycerol phosphate synthase subunit HisH [Euryarchaeota archaeon]
MDPRAPRVTLFDYGVGNLHSMQKALEKAGADVSVTQEGNDLLSAEAIVLPGVGAFGACMERLLPVREALRERLESGTPCLAVCIGMHLLYEGSEESPDVPGVGFLKGVVRTFPKTVGKVPHMGWNEVVPQTSPAADVHAPVPERPVHAYFVHSYYVPPDASTRATTDYGLAFASMGAKGRTVATQFHPEKSSTVGLGIIRRWVGTLGGAA